MKFLYYRHSRHCSLHNFEIYSGKILPVEGFPNLGASSNIVLKTSEVVQSHMNHALWFDNWFSSVNLRVELAKQGFFVMATARSNFLLGCSLITEKELKKQDREVLKKKKHSLMVSMWGLCDGLTIAQSLWPVRALVSKNYCILNDTTKNRNSQLHFLVLRLLFGNTTKTRVEWMH